MSRAAGKRERERREKRKEEKGKQESSEPLVVFFLPAFSRLVTDHLLYFTSRVVLLFFMGQMAHTRSKRRRKRERERESRETAIAVNLERTI